VAKLKWFEEQSRLGRRRQFGASSERTDPNRVQLPNEPEAMANPVFAEPTIEKITY